MKTSERRPEIAALDDLPIIAMAQVAHTSKVRALLTTRSLDTIEADCRDSVCWPQFCALVAAGKVGEDWLPEDRSLGKMIYIWATRNLAPCL